VVVSVLLKQIFDKPVDRKIEGVIKADDEAALRLEVEEYVLTQEVTKRLENFLEAYTDYSGANGVWISGFFGSGKSHLLKILSMILENRQIEGLPVLDLFLEKCEDSFLLANLKKAAAIPSQSILFNIDQKADVISKTQIDALLAVFMKVFDDFCGYYGKQGYIADFERDLDKSGLYSKFKEAYQKIAGKDWETGREEALLFEGRNIAKAYAQLSNEPESFGIGILDKYRAQYKVSIEDFADKVWAYISSQKPKFRLNFFVDEVGQYIADNTKLMTNLQTIAESLATRCRGQAWLIVTAQEDMSAVVGEMGKQQANDFSKIQARFATRMKLTSADVQEVIKKRLLKKTVQASRTLEQLYHRESNNFKTLFDFGDGSYQYKNFVDQDDFVDIYPFVPYQFGLFQAAIEALSQHNAFEGKHSSVGARSMLGVFQEVARHIGSHQLGELATFDLMYDGIQKSLKSQVQRSISNAGNQLSNDFAVRLLKTLLLVKYVKVFKPTVRNLSVLMLSAFDADLPSLRAKIQEALDYLQQNSLVQKNSDCYEYLTDEEQDIEREIGNTDVEASDVIAELKKVVFEEIIKDSKFRLAETGQDFAYSHWIDDRIYGREQELALHLISPFHENSGRDEVLRLQCKHHELLVLLPPDKRLMDELKLFKRTDKFVRQNTTLVQRDAVKRILDSKQELNTIRRKELVLLVAELLGKARLMVSGSEIVCGHDDAQSRIREGLKVLVGRVYPNLKMLKGVMFSENEIKNYLKPSLAPQGHEVDFLPEPQQEMLAAIQRNQMSGLRSTVKTLLEHFEKKPYGWPVAAVLCHLAQLCSRGKVEIRRDSNVIEIEKLEQCFRNSSSFSQLVLEPQVEFSQSQIRALKDFFEEFFNSPAPSKEPKVLGRATEEKFNEYHQQFLPLLNQNTIAYPFLPQLREACVVLKSIINRPYHWYLTEFLKQEEELFKLKEQLLEPVVRFISGPQKEIFHEALEFLNRQSPNFDYIDSDSVDVLRLLLLDPDCLKSNTMQQIKSILDDLKSKVSEQLLYEVNQARQKVMALHEGLREAPEFQGLNQADQKKLEQRFAELNQRLSKESLIAVIRELLRRFAEEEYQQMFSTMASMLVVTASVTTEAKPNLVKLPLQTKVEVVSLRSISVHHKKALLVDEADVDSYLASVRESLIKEIRKGKRVQV